MAQIMGIINVTPDSFWSGSRVQERGALLERVRSMVAQGVHVIDVGGCSTRPNSTPATEEQEMERLEWGLEAIRTEWPDVPISVDTYRVSVAERCSKMWHVEIINDVSGGERAMYEWVAQSGASYVLTWSAHVSNVPQEALLPEMKTFFEHRLMTMSQCGVDIARQVILDPGFGFGKSIEQNYHILAHLECLKVFNLPILAGLSRKSMAYKLLGITPQESLPATMVMNSVALMHGADWLRVHDVTEALQAVQIINAVNGNK